MRYGDWTVRAKMLDLTQQEKDIVLEAMIIHFGDPVPAIMNQIQKGEEQETRMLGEFATDSWKYQDWLNHRIKRTEELAVILEKWQQDQQKPAASQREASFNNWRLLGKLGFSMDEPDQDGNTKLLRACDHGDLEAVQVLIEAGANVNQANNDGITALISAVYTGHLELAQELLKAGADINCTVEGNTPLVFAVYQDNLPMVELLLKYKAHPKAELVNNNEPVMSLVALAQEKGFDQVAEALVKAIEAAN